MIHEYSLFDGVKNGDNTIILDSYRMKRAELWSALKSRITRETSPNYLEEVMVSSVIDGAITQTATEPSACRIT